MVDLMLAGDEGRIRRKGIARTVYDPCCGSGGMLMITREHITVGLRKKRRPASPRDRIRQGVLRSENDPGGLYAVLAR